MGYIKIFDVYETDAEKVINGYLKAVYEKKHSVMGARHTSLSSICLFNLKG